MNPKQHFFPSALIAIAVSATLICPGTVRGQEKLPLNDLSAFQSPAANWLIAGDVKADLSAKDLFQLTPGTGILVDQLSKTKQAADLLTAKSYGDLDLELDYMIAKGSNSGIYLQGRYEVQLEDSWALVRPTASDNGAIYQRWDDSRPDGQQGYEGHAPRQNASRGPGLWQHLKISFQAPRFDAAGNKTDAARVLLVELNGVTVQENVALSGVTRGAIDPKETASGPLRIQGDHGSVAIRNIVVTDYGKTRPVLTDLQYTLFAGKYEREKIDLAKLRPTVEGPATLISNNVKGMPAGEFVLRYKGTLKIKESGLYILKATSNAGGILLFVDGRSAIDGDNDSNIAKIQLPAGDHTLDFAYYKTQGFSKPALGLTLQGPGIRTYALGDPAAMPAEDQDDPILINAGENTVMRSFMDLKGEIVTHAVSVGSPAKVNYTYDLDHGMIVQVWRGDFLDATPMWHDRGNGQSIPRGAVQRLGKPAPAIEKLATPQTAWTYDTTGSGYRPKGYSLDKSGLPTFQYLSYGTAFTDKTNVTADGHGISREITVASPVQGLYIRLADASSIEELSKGLYLVDDKSYYLQLENPAGAAPLIREHDGRKELIVPIQNKLSYSIIF